MGLFGRREQRYSCCCEALRAHLEMRRSAGAHKEIKRFCCWWCFVEKWLMEFDVIRVFTVKLHKCFPPPPTPPTQSNPPPPPTHTPPTHNYFEKRNRIHHQCLKDWILYSTHCSRARLRERKKAGMVFGVSVFPVTYEQRPPPPNSPPPPQPPTPTLSTPPHPRPRSLGPPQTDQVLGTTRPTGCLLVLISRRLLSVFSPSGSDRSIARWW